jgi:hypothetical protein
MLRCLEQAPIKEESEKEEEEKEDVPNLLEKEEELDSSPKFGYWRGQFQSYHSCNTLTVDHVWNLLGHSDDEADDKKEIDAFI